MTPFNDGLRRTTRMLADRLVSRVLFHGEPSHLADGAGLVFVNLPMVDLRLAVNDEADRSEPKRHATAVRAFAH